MSIEIKRLESGYYFARGVGPCNWAQWPVGEKLAPEHFFDQAGDSFRRELAKHPLATPAAPLGPVTPGVAK